MNEVVLKLAEHGAVGTMAVISLWFGWKMYKDSKALQKQLLEETKSNSQAIVEYAQAQSLVVENLTREMASSRKVLERALDLLSSRKD